MFVFLERSDNWALGFHNESWNLRAGDQISLSVSFDGRAPYTGSAQASDAHFVLLRMAQNPRLWEDFRQSLMMKIEANGQIFPFALTGTSRLLVDLSRCVQTELAIEKGEPPPRFADAAPAPKSQAIMQSPSQGRGAELELAATRIASNLLLGAKLAHAHLLAPNETPAGLKGRGVAWTSDTGLGAVWILPASVAADPQKAASQLISSDAADCTGDFVSGRSSELVDDKLVSKAFTACTKSSGTRAFRYFIIQRPGSGFIVYELTGAPPSPTNGGNNAAPSDTTFQAAAVKAAFSP